MKILHNHLGYLPNDQKIALIETDGASPGAEFALVDAASREVVLRGAIQDAGAVAGWRGRHFWSADFSSIGREGQYFLTVPTQIVPLVSAPFQIAATVYDGQIVSDLVHYLKSQRCTGIFDVADRSRPKYGSEERADVHGGWYDASGDASKYLSHLSYANYMNPQQMPQVVWNLIDGRARLPKQSFWLDERMMDEALHGADFLVRMFDAAGYFYMTVFDRWSKDVNQRDICSYATQQGHKFDTYQAGFRQGAGSAIAALARAARLERGGEFPRQRYLDVAMAAFDHLAEHNQGYLDDGRENIIDDYCALLAATELFAASGEVRFAGAASARVQSLAEHQTAEGWFWADKAKTRSYFHAAEAGLPYIALMRYLEVLPNEPLAATASDVLRRGLQHELLVTGQGANNPFSYPRQYVVTPDIAAGNRFFIPHQNESGYWWQGENARLGSLASAALMAADQLATEAVFSGELKRLAHTTLDWIFGRNPFDSCMMQGHGHNNPQYERGFWNAPGGVCNGITSGLDDEEDIDFRMPQETVPGHSWRWSEQWIPHGAWLFHALASRIGQAPTSG
jgi:hypothetical protein